MTDGLPVWLAGTDSVKWKLFVAAVQKRFRASYRGSDRAGFYRRWASALAASWYGDMWVDRSPDSLARRIESVRQLCRRLGVSLSGMAVLVGVSRWAVYRWLRGLSNPSLDAQIAMGLLWETGPARPGAVIDGSVAGDPDALRLRLRRLGLRVSAISRACCLSRPTVRNLLSGRAKPRRSTLEKIAAVLGEVGSR